MKPSAIVTALISQLQNYSNLSYVKQVLSGVRELESVTMYPSIIVDMTSDVESESVYNTYENHFIARIIGLIRVSDKDLQLVGDANTKGILDLLNDVKLAIDSDKTIGGNASHSVIGTTESVVDFPIRQFVMEVDIWYSQVKGVRT